jgi:hypothetical protein
MSRTSQDKKPVGLGTHITAGGIAGAMEAVRLYSYSDIVPWKPHHVAAMLPTA